MPYKSQNNEAESVIGYFNGVVGNLLSVGENDGITLSNSYDLIHMGWQGVLVEPGEKAFDKLQYRYKYNHGIATLNFAIGEYSGPGVFCDASDSLLSTTDPALLAKWKTVTHKQVQVEFYSFKDAYEVFPLKRFDFISIDAEGMDYDILKQMDLAELQCKCICVEHNSDHERYLKIKEHCAKFGLTRELLFNGENTILAI